MAGNVYQSTRDPNNYIPAPSGWTQVTGSHLTIDNSSFEAGTYTNGSDYVIAFAGTAQGVDWLANSGLATGLGADQLLDAALYYVQLRVAHPNANISFTGHSLGGGLAALMGVFFDQATVTFDQAPFNGSVSNPIRDQIVAYLHANGYGDRVLAQYVPALAQFNINNATPRIANVTGFYVQREVLQGLPFNTIGVQNQISHGSSVTTNPIDLHSQALLNAFALNDSFRTVTTKLPDLVKMIFDSDLFYKNPITSLDNFIDRLVRHQVGVSA